MMTKRPLDPRRLRRKPPCGFGWIDHRLLREGYLARCTPQALALYCLLVCASDERGLSFYSDPKLCAILGLESGELRRARRDLIQLGLIAHQAPICQLLALEETPPAPSLGRSGASYRLSRRAQAPSAPLTLPAAPPAPAAATGLDLRTMVRAALWKGGQA
jgi:hypothetical protein